MNPSAIDFRRFVKLFEAYCPSSQLHLYTAGGQLVWLHEGAAEAPQSFDLAAWTPGIGGRLWHSDENGESFAWPVNDEQQTVTHYLIVRSNIAAGDREKLYARTTPALETIAFALKTQLYLSAELDAMARELAVRYEELNLVYYTDDEVRFLDEGRQALCGLVENCNEYLNVDLTAFMMPDQGICIVQNSRQSPIKSESVLPLLHDKLLALLKAESRTIVFSDRAETEAMFGFAYPMIASPVHDGNGEVAGALIIIRESHSQDFANSDRNLLVVMAGKASKIIQSSYDSLTGLMRQEGFDRSLASALAHAQYNDQKNTLLHVNIDRVHLINDTLGYQAGDQIIQSVAATLRSKLRESDRIARLGGDEFGILLHNCSMTQGEIVAEKLCRSISSLQVDCGTQAVDVTVCIGVAVLDKHSGTTISAHAGAEIACSVAKELGRDRWQVYSKDDPALIERQQQMEWVGRLKDAIRDDRLRLYSQKIVPLSKEVEGYHFEILVRMEAEDGKILPPGVFLPVAERYQMMPVLDRLIVENTLKALAAHAQVMKERQIVCSINLSGQTLVDQDFSAFVIEQFKTSGVSPSLICFEITETAAIANLEEAERLMHELKGLGCTFSLDDFGAGLSSFAYLRTLPVDYLKLDGSFVTPIAEDETAAAMLAAMNQIGQIVGLRTVAEFVESQAIIDRLKEIGVDYAQGYGISKPRPVAEELSELSRVAERA